ncbi:MAG: hypothetical protein FWD63_07370 [Propionibacteriaceae bacterium]|nr:hypothetical protein [Propionibacteriaceae bacterium]
MDDELQQVEALIAAHAGDPAVVAKLRELQDAIKRQRDAQKTLDKVTDDLASAGGDDVMRAFGVTEVFRGPRGDLGFQKWGVRFKDGDDGPTEELVFLLEKGGSDTISGRGVPLADGSWVAEGSTAYFMDAARHHQVFRAWLADPAHAETARGLKDGTVKARYILATNPGDGPVDVKDLVLNPAYLDWTWVPV